MINAESAESQEAYTGLRSWELGYEPSGSDGGGFSPPAPVVVPPGETFAYQAFETGLGQEIQYVQRVSIKGQVYKCQPVAHGPIAFDIDAPKGGKLHIVQADSLESLNAGKVRIEVWTFAAAAREIKGLAPTRRFVVVAAEGEEMRVQPRPLGWAVRGPSVWKLGPTVQTWSGL